MRLCRAAGVLVIAVGLLVSGVATCVAEAAAPRQEQMACCKAGHEACGPHGAPADCCAKAPHATTQFTPVVKTDAPIPMATASQAIGALVIAAQRCAPSPMWLVEAASPPDAKHPTYLVISILRV